MFEWEVEIAIEDIMTNKFLGLMLIIVNADNERRACDIARDKAESMLLLVYAASVNGARKLV